MQLTESLKVLLVFIGCGFRGGEPMFPPFWYFLTDTSDNTRDVFSAVGKLLYVGTRYETDCRALRTVLDLKRAVNRRDVALADQDSVEDLVDSIRARKLHEHIQRVCGLLGLETPFDELLMAAKESRNFVAHELTIGLETRLQPDRRGVDTLYGILGQHAETILRGELIVLLITAEVTHDEPPPRNYVSQNMAWLFRDQQEPKGLAQSND